MTDHLEGGSMSPTIIAETIHDRIAKTVADHPIVLFMKGTPGFPQCGFSAAVVKILQRHAVPVRSFDVLADPELRQGIKSFSDWPTIPQLYVGGSFVGGSDIIREMEASGELEALLSPHRPAAAS
jgi:monothiol glutaredoxin